MNQHPEITLVSRDCLYRKKLTVEKHISIRMESKKRVYRRFSREEKIEILRTIYEGKMSKYPVCKKYNLWNSVLKDWIDKYSNEFFLAQTNSFDEVMGKSKNKNLQKLDS